ncbi:MAG: HAD hydrolase-like protein [Phycisphaerales bacterium]
MHLVMFDIDGTLTQSCGIDSRCFVDALCEVLCIESIDTDWSNYRHTTDSGIAHEIITKQLGRPACDEELAAVKTSFVQRLRSALDNDPAECQANAGTQEILEWINHHSKLGYAVATGGWSESAHIKLTKAGIKVPKSIIASSDDAVAREKIMRIAERRAIRAYGVDRFESITYVGDAVWDLRAAETCKYSFIGVAVGDAARQLREAGAESLVTSFAEGSGFRDLVERKLFV